MEPVLYSHFCTANRPICFNTQTCYLPEYSCPKIPKICDLILVTLLKMQPHYSQSRRENATPSSQERIKIQRHIPISLSLGSAPPPPSPGARVRGIGSPLYSINCLDVTESALTLGHSSTVFALWQWFLVGHFWKKQCTYLNLN